MMCLIHIDESATRADCCTTIDVVLVVVATAVVAGAAVVVAVGRLRRHGRLQLRSQKRSAGVERRRSSGRLSGVQVDLLQKRSPQTLRKFGNGEEHRMMAPRCLKH
jgi:hypothetical protein